MAKEIDLMIISNGIPELDATVNAENVNEASFNSQSAHGRKWKNMPRFEIGDRVEIVGDIRDQFPSSLGIITATERTLSLPKFRVRLAEGTESAFCDSQ